jgi:hypothetical protein
MSSEPTGVEKACKEAGSGEKLSEILDVSPMAVSRFRKQGYFPLPRAKTVSELYGIPLRELVAPDIRAAMDADAATR